MHGFSPWESIFHLGQTVKKLRRCELKYRCWAVNGPCLPDVVFQGTRLISRSQSLQQPAVPLPARMLGRTERRGSLSSACGRLLIPVILRTCYALIINVDKL